MKQQTALEWFMYKVDECENTDDFLDAYNEAKEMEKEQIIESWLAGENDGSLEPKAFVEMAEQYYNDTYNQK
jgi:hypothetical protein